MLLNKQVKNITMESFLIIKKPKKELFQSLSRNIIQGLWEINIHLCL